MLQQKHIQMCFTGTMSGVWLISCVFKYPTKWKHAMIIFANIWNRLRACRRLSGQDRIPPPPSSNIKDESAFKCYFPFLQPTLSHPGGGVRRLLSSYCSGRPKQFYYKWKHKIQIQNTKYTFKYKEVSAGFYCLVGQPKSLFQHICEYFKENVLATN